MANVTSPLDRLSDLSKEAPDRAEFEGLRDSGLARLKDAENRAISLPSRFDLAYNAAHALCLAALRYRGYRPQKKRFIVFQVLPHTLDLGPAVWRVLDSAHKRRNTMEYDGYFDVDDRLVNDVIAACQAVAKKVRALPSLD